ncbi:hypothetical protein [Paenibacillus sp. J2TS4]|uniref:hypothetical protein n=1 Tax=Paenibacillus sp. J2TS4 TaxID=2807194 RepID=UPI001B063839|nr:hypothetical protein [Paenibacillus sp. J2TS4]GIP36660.1 hypothetical protein J2TS4_58700 [Paenibacillus sp. J2TS4]
MLLAISGRNATAGDVKTAYSNQVKNIKSHFRKMKDWIQPSEPFTLVLFELTFKPSYDQQIHADSNEAVNFIREYIHLHLYKLDPGSLTFQIEKDQIVSLIFAEDSEQHVRTTLEELKKVFDLDRELGFLTTAASPQRRDSSQLAEAYTYGLN